MQHAFHSTWSAGPPGLETASVSAGRAAKITIFGRFAPETPPTHQIPHFRPNPPNLAETTEIGETSSVFPEIPAGTPKLAKFGRFPRFCPIWPNFPRICPNSAENPGRPPTKISQIRPKSWPSTHEFWTDLAENPSKILAVYPRNLPKFRLIWPNLAENPGRLPTKFGQQTILAKRTNSGQQTILAKRTNSGQKDKFWPKGQILANRQFWPKGQFLANGQFWPNGRPTKCRNYLLQGKWKIPEAGRNAGNYLIQGKWKIPE
jgi:hypothetical protein